jgi:3-oxoacyl-[acyl-carrier protein] reductase
MDKPVVLITGASRGIGRAVAVQLAQDGSRVVINYHTRREAAEAVRELIEREGGEAVVRGFDVSKQSEVEEAVQELTSAVGPIQVLVNNAAVGSFHMLMRMPDEAWHEVIDTDLNRVYYCTKAVVRTWAGKRRPGRRIIAMTSNAGEAGYMGTSHYCAAKTGIIAFSKALARELAPLGITVNVIAPGFIATEGSLSVIPVEKWLEKIPLGRTGRPEEVAYAVSFLVSERANYITGQVIRVNGGLIM